MSKIHPASPSLTLLSCYFAKVMLQGYPGWIFDRQFWSYGPENSQRREYPKVTQY